MELDLDEVFLLIEMLTVFADGKRLKIIITH